MNVLVQSDGKVDPLLLEAFQAQSAPAHADFLESTHRRNCVDILSSDTVSPEIRTKAVYGQIHTTEVPLLPERIIDQINRAKLKVENTHRFSPNKGEEMSRVVEEIISSDPTALIARLQAVEWLRGILPEEYQPEFDVESYLAVGDVEEQIKVLGQRDGDVPEKDRRFIGSFAIAS